MSHLAAIFGYILLYTVTLTPVVLIGYMLVKLFKPRGRR